MCVCTGSWATLGHYSAHLSYVQEMFKLGPQICQTCFAVSLEGCFFPKGKPAHLTSKESLEIPIIVSDKGRV